MNFAQKLKSWTRPCILKHWYHYLVLKNIKLTRNTTKMRMCDDILFGLNGNHDETFTFEIEQYGL